MWNLPRPGMEPMFPTLQGRFLTTELPGKSQEFFAFLLCAVFGAPLKFACRTLIRAPLPRFPSSGYTGSAL